MSLSVALSLVLAADGSVTIVGDKGRRNRTAGSIHQLDELELERFERDDVQQVLADVPGVYARDEEGFGLRPNIGLRGASPERSAKITLMEDGVLIAPAPYSEPAAYFFPLTTRMSQVEVFKGPAAVGYGPQTIGGAVNLVSRPLLTAGSIARLDLAYGDFNTSKGHLVLGHHLGGFSLQVEGLHLRSDGFQHFRDDAPAGGYEKNEWMVKAGWSTPKRPGLGQQVELKLGYADEQAGSSYLGLHVNEMPNDPFLRYDASRLDEMRWDLLQGSLRHRLRFGPGKRLETVAYRQHFHRDWFKAAGFEEGPSLGGLMFADDSGDDARYLDLLRGEVSGASPEDALRIANNERFYLSEGLQTELAWRWRHRHWKIALRSGLRAHHDQVDREKREQGYDLNDGRLSRNGTAVNVSKDNMAWTRALSGHAAVEFAWNKSLWITPGLRSEWIENGATDHGKGERSDDRFQNAWLPGLGLFWKPGEAPFGLLAGLHRGFSPVAPGQDSTVMPEASVNYEAGLRWFPKNYHFELIGFLNDYSNLTARCTQSQGCGEAQVNQQFNGGAVRIQGVEMLTKNRFMLPAGLKADVGASLTWTQTAFQSDFSSAFKPFGEVEAGDELPYVPELQGSISAGFLYGPFGVNWQGKGRSDVRDKAGQGEIIGLDRVPGFLTHDLSASWDVSKSLRLYTTAYNITDRVYVSSLRPYGPRPGAPRRLMGGLKLIY